MRRASSLLALAALALPVTAVGAERPFRMGFTPFPYDVTDEAIAWTYERIGRNADLIAHHFDTGVPWPEALAGDPYPALVESQLVERQEMTPDGHTVYLAVTPISTLRDGLAAYWGNAGAEPPPGRWASRGFGNAKVIDAFTNHCVRLIERLDPDFMAYAVEVDILARNDPQAFKGFRKLARKVYRRLKQHYPELPIFLTFTLGQPGDWELIRSIVEPLLPFTDLLAISTYPYLASGFDGNPNRIPDSFFSRIRELDPDKPIAVAETGFTAEPVIFETLGLEIPGRGSWQRSYVRRLLSEAAELDMVFVVWFTIVDYDAVWVLMEEAGVTELFKAWRDTGLYDQDLRKRGALKGWRGWLRRRYAPASRTGPSAGR